MQPQVTLVAAADLGHGRGPRPFYKSAQWSADGTTVITSTSDNRIVSYVLPDDLLDPQQDGQLESNSLAASESDSDSDSDSDSESDSDGSNSGSSSTSSINCRHRRLVPQGRLCLPEPANALASAPYYSLALPWSQSVLVSCRDLPIHLYSLFPEEGDSSSSSSSSSVAHARPRPLASYPLIKTETEAYLAPNALLWPSPGTHFVAGTTNLLVLFDISRTANDPPLLRVPTIASTRHLRKGNGVGMRGTVAALSGSIGPGPGPGLVAAGTWTRWIGLYDLARAGGECVATWSVARASSRASSRADSQPGVDSIGGGGILQTLWSPCGRYLVVNERRSRGLLVYDVRGSGELLCCLTGRPAETNQRLSCDVYMSASAPNNSSVEGKVTDGSNNNGSSGFEVWAGTQNGTTVVWEGIGRCGGNIEPSWSWMAHSSAVSSTAMHASGSVIATCSGSWALPGDDDANETDDASGYTAVRTSPDTTLKLWTLA
ncbi:WD repeat-containing protein [Grosmannia clavigera kw1407]|uniref:WD repeat-containing protein n=1 Tax=Grosmannia clavigera (strain kw1407 / UAMH 11150) TaxID=655863 RepID=F0X8D9_GROCL|nr:WD repeat-containing protein [Grosmannia clavigera kw1407]EFX05954.1 WD repeat-containing protein [Grosmannia clavigera kw1407]